MKFTDYPTFARAVYETGILSDPWFDGTERFGLRGIVLPPSLAAALNETAERVARLHQELVEILVKHPDLLAEFYQPTPYRQAMWQSAGGLWHGMARADLFVTTDGSVVCCELNSDTPSGQPEAVLLNELLRETHDDVLDPNAGLLDRWLTVLRQSLRGRTRKPLRTVGILYPTELTEDLGMISLFRRKLEAEGVRVVVGSPFNLRRTSDGLAMLGVPVDLVVRHYKTDWWGERFPVWTDAPEFPDPDPLDDPLDAILSAEMAGEVTVVNPFGSVVTQNKLSLAFFREEQARFSKRSQKWIQNHIPETYRMTRFTPEQLIAERDRWVVKSDYGCEGAETVCGPFVTDEVWRKTIETAIPEYFVVQRFFEAQPTDEGMIPNYGVYLLGGSAGGYFTRVSKQSTGYSALTVPTFIAKQE